MIRVTSSGFAAALFLAACATTPVADTGTETASSDTAAAATKAASTEPSVFDLAIKTADGLAAAGNTPTAIDRLTQLLGNPELSDEERGEVHFRRGALRYSATGYNVWGAIEDFEEVVQNYPDHVRAGDAGDALDTARGEATSLTFQLDAGELSRKERFEALFRLGQHQDALDLMQASNLTPDNDHLITMYQVGWLCDDLGLTGRSYAAVEPDGTERDLQFCDLGK